MTAQDGVAAAVRPLELSDDIRTRIAGALPWSPLDFIKGIAKSGDRQVLASSVARSLDPRDDLRFAHALPSGADVAVCAERLPWDSAFFGYDVARLHGVFPLQAGAYDADADYTAVLRALVALAGARGVRYLFAVIDARELPTIRALTALGFALIETRLYYHLALRRYEYPRRFQCRLATAADVDTLASLARTTANPYDRFNADPFIGREAAVRLVDRWIRASVAEGWADATFVPDSPRPNALCTVKYHDDRKPAWGLSIAQLVLAMGETAGSRFLGVIAETTYHLKARGADHVFFTTQLPNHPLIRVAEHLGFTLGRGEHVFRILL